MSLCMCNVTIVDKCKHSTPTSSTHMKKTFKLINTFVSLKVWMDLYFNCVCPVCPVSYLNYVFSIDKWNMTVKSRNPCGDCDAVYLHITCVLCSFNAWLFNDYVTAIRLSYWQRKIFPNYARLHGKILVDCFTVTDQFEPHDCPNEKHWNI